MATAGVRKRPRVVFMAFGTQGDVFPLAALAVGLANAKSQCSIFFVTHSAHESLTKVLSTSNVTFVPITSLPVLPASYLDQDIPVTILDKSVPQQSECKAETHGDDWRSKIENQHRQECFLALEKILGSEQQEGDYIVINFFALEGWHLAEFYQVPCAVAAPYVVPYRDPVEAFPTPKRDEIVRMVERRWKWMHRPIHGIAALLHPAYKALCLHSDAEISTDRDEYLKTIMEDAEKTLFLEELIKYHDQRGTVFTNSLCLNRESMVKPLFWWETFGYQMPHVQKLALKILSQDCSSGACERNWSAYSLIHTKIRNCLTTRQLERLVYCRANMRMVEELHSMDISKQVNVDTFKLTADTLDSAHKERDSAEMEIYAQLFRELEEIDLRISRTRSSRGRGRRITPTTRRAPHTPMGPTTYVRRGSGSSSATAQHEDDMVADLREPEYDEDGNILSEGDYGLISSMEASSEDSGSPINIETSEDEP